MARQAIGGAHAAIVPKLALSLKPRDDAPRWQTQKENKGDSITQLVLERPPAVTERNCARVFFQAASRPGRYNSVRDV